MKKETRDNLKGLLLLIVIAFTMSYVIVISIDKTAEYNEAVESNYINKIKG